jgi:adhesin/invasin
MERARKTPEFYFRDKSVKLRLKKFIKQEDGWSNYISFLIILPILLAVIVGGGYVAKSIQMMATMNHGLTIVDSNMTQDGSLTTNGQTQLISYLQENNLDLSKVYLNATTTPQSYGSRGLEATLGYDFDLDAPGTSQVVWHKYYQVSMPMTQSQLIPGSGADTSGTVPLSSLFAGVQGGTSSGGSSSNSTPINEATSMTMQVNNTSPVENAPLIATGKVYFGSNPAPAGTQVSIKGGGVVQTVSTDSTGAFTANVSFSKTGTVQIQSTSGVATANVSVSVQASVPGNISLQTANTTVIGQQFTIAGTLVDNVGNPVIDGTVVTISSSDTADIPTTTVTTQAGNFTYTVTNGITSLNPISITASAGSISTTQNVTILPGAPKSISLNLSSASLVAGTTITFSGQVLGPYGSTTTQGIPVTIDSGTDIIDTLPALTTDANGNFSGTATLTKAGSQVFYAQTTGPIQSPTKTVTVTAGPPYKIQGITCTPNPVNMGANLAISGYVNDEYNNPIASGTPLEITSSALPSTVSMSVLTGAFNTQVILQTPGVQSLTVKDGSGNLLTGGGLSVNVLPTSAYSLKPSQGQYSVTAGQSVSNVVFTLNDSNGQPVVGKTIQFTETPQGSGVITPASAITDSQGKVSVSVGVLTLAGPQTLTASLADDATVIGTVGITVTQGVPGQVVANVSPSLTQVNPSVAPRVIGTLMDAYGNIISNATVSISGGYGPSSSGTTDVNGNFNIALQANNIGIWPLTINSGSFSASPSGMTLTVSALVNDSLSLNLASSSTVVGQSVQATATLTDASGNPVQGDTVTFSTPGDTTSVLSPQSATTDSQGKAVTNVTFTKVGTESLIAQYQNVAVSTTGTVSQIDLSSQSSTQLSSEIFVNSLNISPSICGINPPSSANYPIVSGQLVDQYNNPMSNITMQISGGWGGTTLATTSSTGYFSASIDPVNLGTFYPTIASGNFTYTSPSVSLQVTANQSYYQITVNAPAGATVGTTYAAGFTVKDQSGNPVSGITPTVTSSDGGMILSTITSSNASGQGTLNVVFDTIGSQSLIVSYLGVQGSATTNVSPLNIGSGGTNGVIPSGYVLQLANLALSPAVVSVGNTAYLTGNLQLKNGTTGAISPATGATISAYATGGGAGWGNTASSIAPTDGSGNFVVQITPSIGGSFNVTLATGSYIDNSSLTLQSTTNQAYTLSVSAPTSVTVGTTNNVTITLKDATGNPVSGQTLTVTSPTQPGATITSPAQTNASGQTTVGVTWTQAGTQIVTATYTNVQAGAVVSVLPIDPLHPPGGVTVNFSFTQNNLSPAVISKSQTAILTGKLIDNFGNPVPNAIVTASTTGNWGTTPSTTTFSDGTFLMCITPSQTGVFPISLATGSMTPVSTGLSLTVSVTQGYTMSFVTVTDPATVGAVTVYKVHLADQSGNPVAGVQPVFNSPTDSTAGSVTGPSTDVNGNSVVSTFSFDKSGVQTLLVTWPGQPNVSCVTAVTVNSGMPTQIIGAAVNPSQVQVGSQAVVTGIVEDSQGNPVSGTSVTVSGGYGSNVVATTDNMGSFVALITASNIGTWNSISVTDGSANATIGPLTVIPKASVLTLIPLLGTSIADENIPFGVVAHLIDGSGNPIQSVPVSFVVSPNASAGFSTNPATTDASGNASPTVTFSQTGDQTVTATCTVNGQALNAKMYIYVSTPVLATIAWTSVTPTTVTAGNTVSVSGQALDQFGHGMPDNTPVTLSMPGSNATNTIVYTYHSGGTYGLFSGTLTPTKAGTWTLYAGGGMINVPYGTGITVNAGSPTNEIITGYSLTAPFYNSNAVNVTGAKDAYSNPTPIYLTVNTSYGGGFPSLSNPYIPDSNGNLTINIPSIPCGKYTIGCTTSSSTYTVTSINSCNSGNSGPYGTVNYFVINQDGSLWVQGSENNGSGGSDGAIGLGGLVTTNGSYMKITSPTIVHPVEVGGSYSNGYWAYVLDGNGTLWATGINPNGGQPRDMLLPYANAYDSPYYTFTTVATNVQLFSANLWYVKTDGTVWYTGAQSYISGAGYAAVTDWFNDGGVPSPGLEVMINATTPLTNVWYINDQSLDGYMEFATTSGQYYWTSGYGQYGPYAALGSAGSPP